MDHQLYNLLIIEDEPILQDMYRARCEELGINCVQIYDGDNAFDFVQDSLGSVHFVILDYMLPGQPGQVILEQIRRNNNHPPVFVVSAIAEQTDTLEEVAPGTVKVIEKGAIPLGQILERIRQYFESQSQVA